MLFSAISKYWLYTSVLMTLTSNVFFQISVMLGSRIALSSAGRAVYMAKAGRWTFPFYWAKSSCDGLQSSLMNLNRFSIWSTFMYDFFCIKWNAPLLSSFFSRRSPSWAGNSKKIKEDSIQKEIQKFFIWSRSNWSLWQEHKWFQWTQVLCCLFGVRASTV